jgi:hypothetical protein
MTKGEIAKIRMNSANSVLPPQFGQTMAVSDICPPHSEQGSSAIELSPFSLCALRDSVPSSP